MFHLRLLGGLTLESSGTQQLGRAGQKRRLALLALIARAPRGVISREKLICILWPELDPEVARARLSPALYDLRQALGEQAIVTHGDALQLASGVLTQDVTSFENACANGSWEQAVALYAGPFLDGIYVDGSAEFEAWATQERDRLSAMFATALESAAASARDANTKAAFWHRRAALDPGDSRVALGRAAALEASGDRRGALAAAMEHVTWLQREIGAQPDRAMTEIILRLRQPVSGMIEAATPADTAPVVSLPTRPVARRSPRTLVIGTGIMAAALVSLLAFRTPSHSDSAVTRVAVLPFSTIGDADIKLRTDLVELLGMSLNGVGDLRTVDAGALLARAPGMPLPPGESRSLARTFNASHYLSGMAAMEGGRLRLHARLHRTRDGVAEAEAEVDGVPADLIALTDRLTAQIVAARAGSPAAHLTRLAASTTTSLQALKAWLAGEAEFRAGRYLEAAGEFTRATQLDSTFALAHYRHSLATLWGNRPGASMALHDAAAERHAGRLPQRERMLVDAYLAWRRGDADIAEELYRRVVQVWPDDAEAWLQLGETLMHYNPLRGRPAAEARAPFERALRLDPLRRGARWHLLLLDALDGRRDALIGGLATLDQAEAGDDLLDLKVLSAWVDGGARAVAAVPGLAGADEGRIAGLAWRLGVFGGDLDAARVIYQALLTPDRNEYAKNVGRGGLVTLALARGRVTEALDVIATMKPHSSLDPRAMAEAHVAAFWPHALAPARLHAVRTRLEQQLAQPLPPMHRVWVARALGLVAVGMGDETAATSVAVELDHLAEDCPEPAEARAYAAGIRGLAAARAGRAEEALRQFEATPIETWFGSSLDSPSLSASHERFARAEMLLQVGRLEEAAGWYRGLTEYASHDLIYLAPAHLRLAEIRDRQGRAAEARAHRVVALRIWRDAEPSVSLTSLEVQTIGR